MPRIEESPPQLRPPGDVALELSSVLHFTLLVARIPAGIVPIGLCCRSAQCIRLIDKTRQDSRPSSLASLSRLAPRLTTPCRACF